MKQTKESCPLIDEILLGVGEEKLKANLEEIRVINSDLRAQSRYWYLEYKELKKEVEEKDKDIGKLNKEIQALKDKVRDVWNIMFTIY